MCKPNKWQDPQEVGLPTCSGSVSAPHLPREMLNVVKEKIGKDYL